MNTQVFGKEHLIYVAISLIVAFLVCFFAKRYAKAERAKTWVVKIAAAVYALILLIVELVRCKNKQKENGDERLAQKTK